MIVRRDSCMLWHDVPADVRARVERAVDRGLSGAPAGQARLFFRADDIGVPGCRFSAMMEIFREKRMPLCLAVVPAWLTASRWASLRECAQGAEELFCWHQHGWRHVNHQREGKKGEFGTDRTDAELRSDLTRGGDRLAELIGDSLFPAFTPPWNRLDPRAREILRDNGCRCLSTSRGRKYSPPQELPDFPVDADLHTRKDPDPETAWRGVLDELTRGIATGCCGVMLHHQRMDATALHFLGLLLDITSSRSGITPVHFGDLTA